MTEGNISAGDDTTLGEFGTYCIKLRTGPSAGEIQTFFASPDLIKKVCDGVSFNYKGIAFFGMSYIARNDTRHGEPEDMLCINKNIDLLTLKAQNRMTANRCMKYLGFPVPFPKLAEREEMRKEK